MYYWKNSEWIGQGGGFRQLSEGGPVLPKRDTFQDMQHGPIPDRIKESLIAYASRGVPTGDFLRAVLSNDLRMALAKADVESMDALPSIVHFIYNQLPPRCHGSADTVKLWIHIARKDWKIDEVHGLPDLDGDVINEGPDPITCDNCGEQKPRAHSRLWAGVPVCLDCIHSAQFVT